MSGLAARAAALLGEPLAAAERLAGGDLSEVVRLRLVSGRVAVAKGGPAPRAEAGMLEAIRAAGVRCPAVLAVSDEALVLEALAEDGRLTRAAWADAGEQAARLHAALGTSYGWDAPYAFGPVAIPAGQDDDWPRFWAERRLLVGLDARPPDLARRLERLAARLPGLLPAKPPPALLHGDLWAGNLLAAEGRAWLIDPACAHGHGEVDLAMLDLFGAPPPEFAEAYGPPEPGAEARRPVYQLWPALVHLRLFGGPYRGLVDRLLGAAGA